jgi:hypothetical protein
MVNIRKHWWHNKDITEHFCIFLIETYKGYVDLCFQFSNLRIQIFYSTCTNSIDDLINWIKEIDNNKELIYFNIDEEGHDVRIILERVNKFDTDLYEIKIISEDKNYYEYELKKIISKNIFLEKLLYALKKTANEIDWGKNNNHGKFVLENIYELCLKYKTNEYEYCKNCKDKICIKK